MKTVNRVFVVCVFMVFIFVFLAGLVDIVYGFKWALDEVKSISNVYIAYLPYVVLKYYLIGFVLSIVGGIGLIKSIYDFVPSKSN